MKERKKKHILRRVLLSLLALILLTAAVLYVIPLTETVSAEWMAKLDDGLRLNEIVLPGTHDAATQYAQLAFITKCQALSIGEQLEVGYRYLDIRLELLSDGSFRLMHGFTKCKTGPLPWDGALGLDALLEQCYAFLKAHPTETVVFAVKQEHGDQSVGDFAKALERKIAEEPGLWYLGSELPTLGEARGKLVLLRRYSEADGAGPYAGIPMNWPDQGDNSDVSKHTERAYNGAYRLWVQDRYAYGTEDKWTAFLNGLREPAIGGGDLSVSFLSTKGTLAYGHPYAFAKTLNARLLELPSEELRGWIVVDFGDAELAAHIWSANGIGTK